MSKFEKFLEKTGIIYGDENEQSQDMPNIPNAGNENPHTIIPQQDNQQAVKVGNGDIIEEAYAGLPKSEKDIYIVEKLMENFNMLPDEAKPGVVKTTLETMHIDVNTLITEANAKKNALGNTLARRMQQVKAELENLNAIITDAEKKISDCKKQQLNKKNGLEADSKSVTEEIKRLENIIKILGGGN